MLVQQAPMTPNSGTSSTNATTLKTRVTRRPMLRRPGRPHAPRPVAAISDGTHSTADASSISVGTTAAPNSSPNRGAIQSGAVAPITVQPTKLTSNVSRAVKVTFAASRSALFTPNNAPAIASATISGRSETVLATV